MSTSTSLDTILHEIKFKYIFTHAIGEICTSKSILIVKKQVRNFVSSTRKIYNANK